MADGRPPDQWHLVSYPRSGNHLLRTLIESMTGRPTLGCPDNARDTPIYQRVNSPQAEAIEIRDTRPIGYKSHTLKHVARHRRAAEGCWGLIFLTRDPVQAIASQHARRRRQQTLLRWPRHYLKIRRDARNFHDLVDHYAGFSEGPRLHLRFERLTNPATRRAEIERLADAMSLTAPSDAALDRLFGLGKDALQSRATSNRRIHRLHAALVPRHVAYPRVLARIAQADEGAPRAAG